MPFGAVRTDVGTISQTDFGYTFQRDLGGDVGLLDYRARFYDPYINRFIQPDSIVPRPGNPQSWNRYAYVLNDPIRYSDPTGHWFDEGCGSGGSCELPPIIGSPDDDENDGEILDTLIDQFTDFGDIFIQDWNNLHHGSGFWENYCGKIGNTVDLLNCSAMATQDISTLIDIVGVGVEWTLVGLGCFSGGQAGCLVGYWEAEEIWILGGPNSAETIFSNISAVLTISADYIDDRKLGEASATTFATAGAGLFSVEPTTDLLIDGYGTGYNHGIFCGISTILNCFSAP